MRVRGHSPCEGTPFCGSHKDIVQPVLAPRMAVAGEQCPRHRKCVAGAGQSRQPSTMLRKQARPWALGQHGDLMLGCMVTVMKEFH